MTETELAGGAAAEDVCVVPAVMRRYVIPRRGVTVGAPPVVANAGTGQRYRALLKSLTPETEAALDEPQSDKALVAEFRAAGLELETATPLGVAVGAALLVHQHMLKAVRDFADLVDAWVAVRGLVFATEAMFELFGVSASPGWTNSTTTDELHLHRDMKQFKTLDTGAARFTLAARLRQHLAFAAEEDYAAAGKLVAEHWERLSVLQMQGRPQRVLASFLMPEHTERVDLDIAAYSRDHRDTLTPWMLCCSISTEEQGAAFARLCQMWTLGHDNRTVWTALDGAGAALLPALTIWLDSYNGAGGIQRILSLIGCLPTDEAFDVLVDGLNEKYYTAAVSNAARRFPRRALRMLATAAMYDSPRGQAAAGVLRMHTLGHYELVQAMVGELGPTARALVEEILAANVRVPDADEAALPEILVSPPWLSRQKAPAPVVMAGLAAPAETAMAWRLGELLEWEAQVIPEKTFRGRTLEEIAEAAAQGKLPWYESGRFVAHVPEDQVRPVLPHWDPDAWQSHDWSRKLVARFGVDALPVVLRLARKQPASYSFLLMPFACSEVVPLVTDWLARVKSARPYAMAWLNRHPGVAARALIPVALGKKGKARDTAEAALRAIADNGNAEQVAEAAAAHGEAVAAAIQAILADDGSLALPKAMPELPAWAEPASLPQVLLKGRQTALPKSSVKHLLLMLAISRPGAPYVGVLRAREVCDRASLTAFAWALFQNWRGADYPAKENWALDALRWLGDDETVRRLSPMIRLWPGNGGHHRAVAGLDVLAEIGGDTAMMHLYGIAQKAKFKGLKDRATERVAGIAEDLGLTGDQLGDRLVPDLGLDAGGSLTLDYGPRRFTVGFDEQLRPFVADESGRRLKTLPKPGARDDAEVAEAAAKRFAGLKKDVRTLAADQIARMELAMVGQRRWTAQEFRDYFVAHPVLRHIVSHLVWATFAGDGTVGTAFRVAEDLSFADVSEDVYVLPDDAVVGIAHPLHLGDALTTWSEVFADYEILQPFPQLGRPVFVLSEEEKASQDLSRFTGVEMAIGKVLGMERRGWQRGAPQDAGIQGWISRPLPDGRAVTANLDPGIAVGYVSGFGEIQKFREVWISPSTDRGGYTRQDAHPTFATLDAVTASEILRDLTAVTTP